MLATARRFGVRRDRKPVPSRRSLTVRYSLSNQGTTVIFYGAHVHAARRNRCYLAMRCAPCPAGLLRRDPPTRPRSTQGRVAQWPGRSPSLSDFEHLPPETWIAHTIHNRDRRSAEPTEMIIDATRPERSGTRLAKRGGLQYTAVQNRA
jgi:hypothetical protein